MPYQLRIRALKLNPNRINTLAIDTAVGVFMKAHLERVLQESRKYPAPIPDSKYVRTYKLYDSWHVTEPRRTALGLECSLLNFASDRDSGRRYMPFVQGPFQSSVHQGRWTRVDEVNRSHSAEYRAGIQRIYTAAIRKDA